MRKMLYVVFAFVVYVCYYYKGSTTNSTDDTQTEDNSEDLYQDAYEDLLEETQQQNEQMEQYLACQRKCFKINNNAFQTFCLNTCDDKYPNI